VLGIERKQIYFILYFILFILVLGLELRAYTSSPTTSPYFDFFFQDRVSRTVCLGWVQTMILLISAS
jgi:hypothetical protein